MSGVDVFVKCHLSLSLSLFGHQCNHSQALVAILYHSLVVFCKIHSTLCLTYSTFDLVIHGHLRGIFTSLYSKLKLSSILYLKFQGVCQKYCGFVCQRCYSLKGSFDWKGRKVGEQKMEREQKSGGIENVVYINLLSYPYQKKI